MGELNQRANCLANALLDLGIKKGDRIAVALKNSIPFIEIRLACYKAGFVFCALLDDYEKDRLSGLLTDLAPAAFFFNSSWTAKFVSEILIPSGIPFRFCPAEDSHPAATHSYSAMINSASSAEPDVRVAPDELSAIGYTSGSTGKPKGVMWTHAAWLESFYHLLLNGTTRIDSTSSFLFKPRDRCLAAFGRFPFRPLPPTTMQRHTTR